MEQEFNKCESGNQISKFTKNLKDWNIERMRERSDGTITETKRKRRRSEALD